MGKRKRTSEKKLTKKKRKKEPVKEISSEDESSSEEEVVEVPKVTPAKESSSEDESSSSEEEKTVTKKATKKESSEESSEEEKMEDKKEESSDEESESEEEKKPVKKEEKKAKKESSDEESSEDESEDESEEEEEEEKKPVKKEEKKKPVKKEEKKAKKESSDEESSEEESEEEEEKKPVKKSKKKAKKEETSDEESDQEEEGEKEEKKEKTETTKDDTIPSKGFYIGNIYGKDDNYIMQELKSLSDFSVWNRGSDKFGFINTTSQKDVDFLKSYKGHLKIEEGKAKRQVVEGEVVYFVGQIANVTDEEIASEFKPLSDAAEFKRIQGKGYGFIHVSDPKDIEFLKNYQGKINVEEKKAQKKQDFRNKPSVFIKGYADATNQQLKDFFGDCGKVLDVFLLHDKGFGFVRFDTEQGQQKAMELNGAEINGCKILVDMSSRRDGGGGGGDRSNQGGRNNSYGNNSGGDRSNQGGRNNSYGNNSGGGGGSRGGGSRSRENRCFVRNLDYSVGTDDLKQFFSDCGNITDVYIPQGERGSKGYGFISFETKDGFKKALQKAGSDMGGRQIDVKE